MVEKDRKNVQVEIMGRPKSFGLSLHSMWSFESLDNGVLHLRLAHIIS